MEIEVLNGLFAYLIYKNKYLMKHILMFIKTRKCIVNFPSF